MAQIGVAEAKPFTDLNSVINEIFMAAKMLSSLWGRVRGGSYLDEKRKEDTFKKTDKYEEIFWEGLAENDKIKKKLEAIIQEIEKICNQIISGKSTLFSIINKKIS